MKTLKSLQIALLVLIPFLSFGQSTLQGDSLFVSTTDARIKVGDELIIGYPSGSDGNFNFVSNNTKKKLGLLSKVAGATASVGSSVVGVGVGSRSVGAIRTGARVAGVAGTTSQVAGVGEILLKGENELTGQRVKVLKFDKSGNEERGIHYYAIVAGSGKSNFKIEIEPAIFSKELAGNNNILFENFEKQ